jgi:hypothetical protein
VPLHCYVKSHLDQIAPDRINLGKTRKRAEDARQTQ